MARRPPMSPGDIANRLLRWAIVGVSAYFILSTVAALIHGGGA